MMKALQKKHLKPALAASLLLHAGLLLWFFTTQLIEKNTINTGVKVVATVSMASSNPQRRARKASASVSGGDDIKVSSLPNTPATAPAQPSTPAADSTTVESKNTAEVATDLHNEVPTSIDAVVLQDSITDYVAALQGSRQQQWLTECQRYRNRYEKQDCPPGEEAKSAQQAAIEKNIDDTFMAWVNGYDRNARVADELVKEGERLHALMQQGGVLGQLASEQYSSKKILFTILSRDTEAQRTSRDAVIKILPIPFSSKNGIAFFGGLFTIGHSGEIILNDKQAKGPALLLKETEFKPHSEQESAEPEFRVIPPLFESAND